MNKFDLTGRKALVTGGARGLGEGMAQALVAAGASVMIGDVLTSQGRDAAGKLSAGGAKAASCTGHRVRRKVPGKSNRCGASPSSMRS